MPGVEGEEAVHMEYDGYDEVVRAWIQGVYDSRGNDAKRTLKFCYDIEQYALKKKRCKIAWICILLQCRDLLSVK